MAYIPSFLRSALEDSRPLQLTFDSVKHTNISSTSSFIYDPTNTPLKNTQQLNVDWSAFENHTFFSSAETKVNLSFDQIINGYPFDGSRAEVEAFFEKLTGFDKWLFDQFPRYKGALLFSGTQVGEDVDGTLGTWIEVKDHAGSLYPEISKNQTGDSIVNPKDGASFTLEMQVFVPLQNNDVQVVFQKAASSTQGISFFLSASTASTVDAIFCVVSDNLYLDVSAPLTKGEFNHVCVTWNREYGTDFLGFFVDNEQVATSRERREVGDLDIDASNVLIGTGSAIKLGQTTYVPMQTFSGSLDELRVFHSARSTEQQELYATKSVYAMPDLKLYYRFNEPPPPLTTLASDPVNSIVLDSSGNSLHAIITNFTGTLRQDASTDDLNPMIHERTDRLIVLFPAYPDTVALNERLMASASIYDRANPNLITRLIPQHYLLEGAAQDGSSDVLDADAVGAYGGSGMPGQGKMTPSQIILSFLYVWARFFDEIKLFLDSFSTLKYLDYQVTDNSPNNFLYDLVKIYGFHLPPLFNDTTAEQYVDGENVQAEISTNTMTLKDVQNEMLRRVLINMPEVIRSKGTQHAIKSFLRSVGIDPSNTMRIREYGGPTTRQLSYAREKKTDSGAMVNFLTSSLTLSPYLSASRVEVGFPYLLGTMVQKDVYTPHGISNAPSDGLLTSGSWTVEGIYKYTPANIMSLTSVTQSLVRLCNQQSTSGSYPWKIADSQFLVANLLVTSASIDLDPRVILYIRPGVDTSSPLLKLQISLPETSFFDGARWNVCFGCERNDAIGSMVSSSYFLRVSTQSEGDITWFASTSSYFQECPTGESNVLREKTRSPCFLAIGENHTIGAVGLSEPFLHNSSVVPSEARTTAFGGWASNLRFWSKALTEDETREHTRNYKSCGVHDPLVNYNFGTTRSGSFEKVRLDTLTKQDTRTAVGSGDITFLDFSLNNMHMSGTGFSVDTRCVVGENFDYSYLSPYFDEASSDEKVRVRGYADQRLIDAAPWASVAPVHEIVKSERPTDDVRMSIEFSLIEPLNRDIVTMFSTFDAIDNAIGSPELVYSPDYPDLANLREIYFNRIKEKMNFQNFFEFFRWFDRSLGTFIEQLVPRKTMFKGTNFVVESHMLERNKLELLQAEIYLGEEDRSRIRDVLLVQQVVGTVKKY